VAQIDNTWWPWKGPEKEAHWQINSDQDQKAATGFKRFMTL